MYSENMEHDLVVEVPADVSSEKSSCGSRTCSGEQCGFSDSKTNLKDAQERSASMRKLCIAVGLCILFMSVEVIGGIKSNSLAILTDAVHLLSDVAAFAVSLFSLWAAEWKATPRQSYGFFRIEILGALVSTQMIWILAGILVYEAINRLLHDSGEVQGYLMFMVSAFGLVVNIIMVLLLGHDHGHCHSHGHGGHGHEAHSHNHDHGFEAHCHGHDHGHNAHSHSHDHGHKAHNHIHDHGPEAHCHGHDHGHNAHSRSHDHNHNHEVNEPLLNHDGEDKSTGVKKKQRNVNMQGDYLHALGDSIQSIGVMIAGAIIWYNPEWKIVDLIYTLIFSVIVLSTTIQMLRNILEVLMESTPREIDVTKLEKGLCEMEEVVATNELHIWAITVGKVLLGCHVIIQAEADAEMVLDKVIDYIKREHNISHVTIQIEKDCSSLN